MNAQSEVDTNTENTLVIKRTFAASAARVYAAWTDGDLLAQWMGPGEIKVTNAEADPRVGGEYIIAMVNPEGGTHTATGTYEEVVANEKLVFNWTWADVEEVTRVTIELRESGENETELTLTHTGFAEADVRDHHEQGWNACMDKLPAAI